MSSVTVNKTDCSSLPELEIKIPPCYNLSHTKIEQGVAALQQIIELAAMLADSVDQVQINIRNVRCDCLLGRLNDPVGRYAEKLKERYPERVTSTAPASKRVVGMAAFIGAKFRLRKELKMHAKCIEGMLFQHGEKVKIVEVFTPDVDLLTELGEEVGKLIDFILAQEPGPCKHCGRTDIGRAESTRLPSRLPALRDSVVGRSSTVVARARTLIERSESVAAAQYGLRSTTDSLRPHHDGRRV